ncbi:MAG: DUF2975 domain-containing protein [Pseudomonadota bacterium]
MTYADPNLDRISSEDDDAALRRRSRWAAHACLALAALTPLAVGVVLGMEGPELIIGSDPRGAGLDPGRAQIAIATAIAALPVLIAASALFAARRCLLRFAEGRWFSPEAAEALRAMAGRVALAAGAGLIAPTLIWLVLSANAAPGGKMLVVAVSSSPVFGMLFAGILWLIADVTARASRMAADLDEIV